MLGQKFGRFKHNLITFGKIVQKKELYNMKKILFRIVLFLGTPITFVSTLWLWFVTRSKVGKIEDSIFMNFGILPVKDQYYQPLINPKKHLITSLRNDRPLPGVNFNDEQQLALLSSFTYANELLQFPMEKKGETEYFYNNGSYGSGDSEYLYNIVRHFKPRKIIEIGSGHSTRMVKNAFAQNIKEDSSYKCKHICIEPYEQPWLKDFGVELIRQRVETLDKTVFDQLEANDILFIDSSHVIRPQGDVLYEFLEVVPLVKKGVIIHVHDIFTPKDYLNEWVIDEHRMWNEQYLLEAFLSCNKEFKIIGAVNYLAHHHTEALAKACPVFGKQKGREPGAFWFQRI